MEAYERVCVTCEEAFDALGDARCASCKADVCGDCRCRACGSCGACGSTCDDCSEDAVAAADRVDAYIDDEKER